MSQRGHHHVTVWKTSELCKSNSEECNYASGTFLVDSVQHCYSKYRTAASFVKKCISAFLRKKSALREAGSLWSRWSKIALEFKSRNLSSALSITGSEFREPKYPVPPRMAATATPVARRDIPFQPVRNPPAANMWPAVRGAPCLHIFQCLSVYRQQWIACAKGSCATISTC